MRNYFKLVFGAALVAALISVLFSCVNGSANATVTEDICHPNNGNGYVHISVDQHSSHFNDDRTPKHTNKDGQSDVYSTNGLCPGEEPPPTDDPTCEELGNCPPEPCDENLGNCEPPEDPVDYCDTVDGVQDEDFNCPPADNPEKPVRSQKCVGNDLVVSVEFPNGDLEHYNHPNSKLCTTEVVDEDPDEPVSHSIGTPKRLASAPEVEVIEEGM